MQKDWDLTCHTSSARTISPGPTVGSSVAIHRMLGSDSIPIEKAKYIGNRLLLNLKGILYHME